MSVCVRKISRKVLKKKLTRSGAEGKIDWILAAIRSGSRSRKFRKKVIKIFEGVGPGPSNNRLDFGGDRDSAFLKRIRTIAITIELMLLLRFL